jgi:hypothetical protein
MKDPEEKEMMAYVAGLIDGDGHIGIRVGARGKLCPLIQLHNSVKQMPYYLNKVFGGTLAYDKPIREGNRVIWKWMLQGEAGCRSFIKQVSQYLVLKKDSAMELLEFIETPISSKDYYQSCKDINLNRKIETCDFSGIVRKNTDDPFFWAYVAGIMDTDGSFSIERSVRKPADGNRQKNDLIKYRPKILLSMVSDRSIKYILSNCECGGLSEVKATTALRGSAFRLSISARGQAIEFLKKCIPFLQTKAVQAINILNFCRNYNPTNGLAKVPEEEKEYRENCYKKIVMLNNTPS